MKGIIFLFLTSFILLNSNTTIQQSSSHPKMKTLGLIGGLSWHSTVEYYSYINQMINDEFGNNTNPPLLLYNINQNLIQRLQRENKWDSIAFILIDASTKLQKAGAEGILFCSNTAHKVYDTVSKEVSVPLLHIADATGIAIRKRGLYKVGLIGTTFTMEENFIRQRLKDKFNIEMIVPEKQEDRLELHRIVQKELSLGIIKTETKSYILNQIDLMKQRGAEGIILGSTEFPLIIKQEDASIPLFNTTLLHSQMAVDFILGNLK
jgi:aspartate racemase